MKKIKNAVGILCIVCCLSGCVGVTETKTIVLPEEQAEAEQVSEGEATAEDFVVKKIYTTNFEGMVLEANSVFFQENNEHGIWYFKKDVGGSKKVSMDYRYGFYEETENSLSGMQIMNMGYENPGEYISPNGKYAFYSKMANSYEPEQLWLMDLETGEEILLLDGAAEGFSIATVKYVNAFSRDGNTLCYGYYPVTKSGWETYRNKLFLYCMDLETKEILGKIHYYQKNMATYHHNLTDAKVYVERFEESIVVTLANDSIYEDMDNVAVYLIDSLPEGGLAEFRGSFLNQKNAPLYLNEEQIILYPYSMIGTREEETLGISAYNFYTDTLENIGVYGMDFINTENEVRELIVLKHGSAIITAEQNLFTAEVNIYLYQQNDDGILKRILYKNAGYVYSLKYDSKYHRLLIDTCHSPEAWEAERRMSHQAVILEFAR